MLIRRRILLYLKFFWGEFGSHSAYGRCRAFMLFVLTFSSQFAVLAAVVVLNERHCFNY